MGGGSNLNPIDEETGRANLVLETDVEVVRLIGLQPAWNGREDVAIEQVEGVLRIGLKADRASCGAEDEAVRVGHQATTYHRLPSVIASESEGENGRRNRGRKEEASVGRAGARPTEAVNKEN